MTVNRILKSRLCDECIQKLRLLNNPKVNEIVADAILKFQPDSVFVSNGSPEDLHKVRTHAVRLGEEKPLLLQGHTVHYDGFDDQGRDPVNTRFLVPKGMTLGPNLNWMDSEEGTNEIGEIMDGIMRGKQMVVSFYSLGPLNSDFAIPCIQITDSYYVAHSEDILYRNGYHLFKEESSKDGFFSFLHSAGALENGISRDVDLRRMFVDLDQNVVYSANTQYAGNTVAAKKLAHRLAIGRAAKENWLAEHILLTGVPSYEGKRTTYLAGAFPSWCGKTSTSMLFNIVGDDLAHIRKKDGRAYAANVEKGMFGVIKDVNSKDDPNIYDILVKPGEIIFSNILDTHGIPYWQGMGNVKIPLHGQNYSGPWWWGKRDANNQPIPLSHDNARFCVSIEELSNFDSTRIVPLDGMIYGGRNSRRPVPVSEMYGWVHGVFWGASIESEPTAATVGDKNIKISINPMANIEFVSISLGKYLENYIQFGRDLTSIPRVFYVNYFLRDQNGKFLNTKMDKKVWIRWMERRIQGKMEAYATPTGYIPLYDDLKSLFKKELSMPYKKADYEHQFMIVIPELLDKFNLAEQYFNQEKGIPREIFDMISIQRDLLIDVQKSFGDTISPFAFADYKVPEALTRSF